MRVTVHQSVLGDTPEYYNESWLQPAVYREFQHTAKYRWLEANQVQWQIHTAARPFDTMIDWAVTADISDSQATDYYLRFSQ